MDSSISSVGGPGLHITEHTSTPADRHTGTPAAASVPPLTLPPKDYNLEVEVKQSLTSPRRLRVM